MIKHEISVSCQVRQQKGADVTQSRAKTFRETLRLPEARSAAPSGWNYVSGKWWLCAKPALSLLDQERVFSLSTALVQYSYLGLCCTHLCMNGLVMGLIFSLILIMLGKERCRAVRKLASKANKFIKCD